MKSYFSSLFEICEDSTNRFDILRIVFRHDDWHWVRRDPIAELIEVCFSGWVRKCKNASNISGGKLMGFRRAPPWERIICPYTIDNHSAVDAFVKNSSLGFAIPYLFSGQAHDYVPDFIIRLKGDPQLHLILETKGYDELMEVKRQAAERWVNAVNADGSHGNWKYAVATYPGAVTKLISDAAEEVN